MHCSSFTTYPNDGHLRRESFLSRKGGGSGKRGRASLLLQGGERGRRVMEKKGEKVGASNVKVAENKEKKRINPSLLMGEKKKEKREGGTKLSAQIPPKKGRRRNLEGRKERKEGKRGAA